MLSKYLKHLKTLSPIQISASPSKTWEGALVFSLDNVVDASLMATRCSSMYAYCLEAYLVMFRRFVACLVFVNNRPMGKRHPLEFRSECEVNDARGPVFVCNMID